MIATREIQGRGETMEGAIDYLAGHGDPELERLQLQARCLEGVTRRLIANCGIEAGMRVLDIGCGAGDVSFLLAEAVGSTGHVAGVDVEPRAVEVARSRATQLGLGHVGFHVGSEIDAAALGPFDAAIGRYVLVHQTDPAATVRRLAQAVKPGGIVGFLEQAMHVGDQTLHPAPLSRAVGECMRAFFRACVPSYDIAGRFMTCFREAGLPAPMISWESLVFGAETMSTRWLAATFLTLRPHIERAGILDPGIGAPETLLERLLAEADADRQFVTPPQVAAWASRPESFGPD